MVSISSQNIQTIAQHEIKQKLQVVEEVSSTSVFNLLVNISVCCMLRESMFKTINSCIFW